MLETMHILTISETGHIVGAVAQTTASGDPTAEEIAGRDMPVTRVRETGRLDPALISLLPAEVLEVKTVPYNAAVIAKPLSHVVDGGRVVQLPHMFIAVGDVHLTHADITLKDGAPGTFGLSVVARGGDPQIERRVQSGKVPTPAADLIVPLSILPGEGLANITVGPPCDVFVALAGKRLTWISGLAP